jgi:putative transcriptional regulator
MNIPGTLLTAPPSVQHPLFNSASVLITELNPMNTTGLIINRESRMTLSEFGERLGFDFDHVPGMLHIGGAERQTSFSILHSPEWTSHNTFRVNEHFAISSDNDVLKRFEVGDEPRQWRMFLGMCLWNPGELENEMNGIGSTRSEINWCTSTCDPELIFETDLEDIWDAALERCSTEFARNFML